jgi:UDP-glucuronate 4-epimerase
MSERTVLVTGAAGFIGSHTAEALLQRGERVVALDNLNSHLYSADRKAANLEAVLSNAPDPSRLHIVEGDIRDVDVVGALFAQYPFDAVVHLAGLAGVRNSLEDPGLYADVNFMGSLCLLNGAAGRLGTRAAQASPVFVQASTSSVYGDPPETTPSAETDHCDRPIQPYAASKRAAEMMCHTYHHLYGLDATVLRFFSVYGPRGRPDMMGYLLADSISLGKQVKLFNGGQMYRDWTFVRDIVAGVVAASERRLGYEIINLGRGEPVLLADFVRAIEEYSGTKANLVDAPPPAADMMANRADITKARKLLGYDPKVAVQDGIVEFLQWYEQTIRPLRKQKQP